MLYRNIGQVFPAVGSNSVIGQKQSQLGVQGMSCQSPVQNSLLYIHTYSTTRSMKINNPLATKSLQEQNKCTDLWKFKILFLCLVQRRNTLKNMKYIVLNQKYSLKINKKCKYRIYFIWGQRGCFEIIFWHFKSRFNFDKNCSVTAGTQFLA